MSPLFKYPHFVVLLAAFVVADVAVAMLTRVANRLGAVDIPGIQGYKTQKVAVPFVGGIGIFIGFISAVLLTLDWGALRHQGFEAFIGQEHSRLAAATIAGGSIIALMGLVDDFISINAVIKFVALIAITAVLWHFGLSIDMFGGGWLSFVIMLFWVVGVVSAFNAIDNTDGVAGTTALVISFWLFVVAWGTSAATAQAVQSVIAVALGGAVLGFLRHNRPSARVYLGNCGAFTVGFFVAVLAVSVRWTGIGGQAPSEVRSAIIPILLVSYPVFDISYTVLMRWKHGVVRNPIQAIVVSGRDHTAHRLKALGLSTWGVIGVIFAVNMVSGAAAWSLIRFQDSVIVCVGAVAGVVVMYTAFGWKLRKAVDLHSPAARISHRVPTGPIRKTTNNVRKDQALAAASKAPLVASNANTSVIEVGSERVTQRRPAVGNPVSELPTRKRPSERA